MAIRRLEERRNIFSSQLFESINTKIELLLDKKAG